MVLSLVFTDAEPLKDAPSNFVSKDISASAARVLLFWKSTGPFIFNLKLEIGEFFAVVEIDISVFKSALFRDTDFAIVDSNIILVGLGIGAAIIKPSMASEITFGGFISA